MEPTYPTSAQEQLEDENDEYAPDLFTPKRKQYSLAFKTDIIKRVENGEAVRSIAKNENIDQSIIYRWLENRDTLILNQSQKTPRVVTNAKGAKFPRLESELIKYVADRRKLKLSVTKKNIQEKRINSV